MKNPADSWLEQVRTALQDDYVVERELGRGGMAAVFLARDIALARRVAIKVMLPHVGQDEGMLDRFVVEARAVAHLDHPNVITIYSVKERAEFRCFVMKYIEGRPLDAVLRDPDPIEPSVALSLLSQVADALQYAHREGIIHRDVKPSNILIDVRGRPVVTDFGIAKVESGRSLTMTGSLLGTPAYMSPEQCRGEPATAASDQYSLGVLAFELLAGRPPFKGSFLELIRAHSDEEPPSLRTLAPHVDDSVEETLLRMLAKEPGDRWPNLAQVSRRITAALPPGLPPSLLRAGMAALARGGAGPGPDLDWSREERSGGRGPGSGSRTSAADGSAGPGPAGGMGVGRSLPDAEPDRPIPGEPGSEGEWSLWGEASASRTTPIPFLSIVPEHPRVRVGEEVQLGLSELGEAARSRLTVRWKSEDPSVVSVDENGLVRGLAEGFAKVTALAGGAVGRAQVTVTAERPLPAAPAVGPGSGEDEPDPSKMPTAPVVAAPVAGALPDDGTRVAPSPAAAGPVPPTDAPTPPEAAPSFAGVAIPAPSRLAWIGAGVGSVLILVAGVWMLGGRGDGGGAGEAAGGLSDPAAPPAGANDSPVATVDGAAPSGSEGEGGAGGDEGDPGTLPPAGASASPAVPSPTPEAEPGPEVPAPTPSTPPSTPATVPDTGPPPQVAVESDPPAAEAPMPMTPEPEVDPGSTPEQVWAMICGDPQAPSRLLATEFAAEPANRLQALYRVQGDADRALLESVLESIRAASQVRTVVETSGMEETADGCHWVLDVDFQWTNPFGQPRNRAVRVRVELEAEGGDVRILALTGMS